MQTVFQTYGQKAVLQYEEETYSIFIFIGVRGMSGTLSLNLVLDIVIPEIILFTMS